MNVRNEAMYLETSHAAGLDRYLDSYWGGTDHESEEFSNAVFRRGPGPKKTESKPWVEPKPQIKPCPIFQYQVAQTKHGYTRIISRHHTAAAAMRSQKEHGASPFDDQTPDGVKIYNRGIETIMFPQKR